MNAIGHSERETQTRVIALFRDELKYRFLGDWRIRMEDADDWLHLRGCGLSN